jgi:DNA-binding winged helix-turn-helix (wHTH) protein
VPSHLPIPHGICFGPFELDPAAGELRNAGTLIKLQPQPFRVLLLLAERAGTVVTREEIQRCLWSESTFVDFEHGINFSINQIRGALADNAEKPRYIETLPRRGYRFIAPVRAASIGQKAAEIIGGTREKDQGANYAPASVLGADLESLKPEKEPRRTTRWRDVTVAGVAMLFIASAVFWFARHQSASAILPPDLKLRQLTVNPPDNPVTSGAISPDGKYLAYTDTKGMHIRLIETGETRIVPQPQELNGKDVEWGIIPQWFPDSTRFLADAYPAGLSPAFVSSQGSSIWIVSVLGGPPRKLRDEATANSISPDGSSISFETNKGRIGDREIWLMGPDGENARKLYETDENSAICCFHWFPHGQRVWYGTTHDALVTRDLSGGPVTPIFPPSELKKTGEYTLLPDSRMLYTRGESGAVGSTCNYWVVPFDERTGAPTD